MPNELIEKIALTMLPGIGYVTARNLLSAFGSTSQIFKERKGNLIKIPGVTMNNVDSILNKQIFARAEKELNFIEKHKISALFYTDSKFPNRLKHCIDAPLILYFKGNAEFNCRKSIAIVGTRKSTDYGRMLTEKLIEDLSVFTDINIISGLAYGIDIAAHTSCLKFNVPTIGILGHGLDKLYPTQHKNTAIQMIANGGLLTEFISETKPDRENFPMRNRIIAGMVDAVVVVEAGLSGGALITAEIANNYNRDVFAYPGRANDEYSQGCNLLIRNNKANLITSAKDIIYLLGWEQSVKENARQTKLLIDLSEDEKVLVQLLNPNPKSTDDLSMLSKMNMSKLAAVLLQLEMNGMIRSLPGKMYALS